MKLDKNYSLSHDNFSWTLHWEIEGEINEKTGKPKVSRGQRYHGRLLHALQDYEDRRLGEANSATEFIPILKDAEKRIFEFLGNNIIKKL